MEACQTALILFQLCVLTWPPGDAVVLYNTWLRATARTRDCLNNFQSLMFSGARPTGHETYVRGCCLDMLQTCPVYPHERGHDTLKAGVWFPVALPECDGDRE